MLAASLTPSRLPFLCELCALCVKIRLPPRAPVSSDLPAKSLRIRTYAKQPPNPCRIRTYKKTGGGAPWRRLQSVLPTHYRASAAKSPAQYAGIRATLISSCAYFITCGHPGGGVSAAPRCKVPPCPASLRYLCSFLAFDFQLSTVNRLTQHPSKGGYTTPIRQKC
jgi:hypothetical protein